MFRRGTGTELEAVFGGASTPVARWVGFLEWSVMGGSGFDDHEPRSLTNREEMVGTTGFEPATSWSQTKCSTGLSYVPNSDERVALDFA